MDEQQLYQFVERIGFPAAVALIVLLRLDRSVIRVEKAVIRLCTALRQKFNLDIKEE